MFVHLLSTFSCISYSEHNFDNAFFSFSSYCVHSGDVAAAGLCLNLAFGVTGVQVDASVFNVASVAFTFCWCDTNAKPETICSNQTTNPLPQKSQKVCCFFTFFFEKSSNQKLQTTNTPHKPQTTTTKNPKHLNPQK